MRRRVIEVELAGVASLVKGYGSRELVLAATGRAPVWSSIRRGWSVQDSTARDVVAAAEAAGYDIVITGKRATVPVGVGVVATEADVVAEAEGLW